MVQASSRAAQGKQAHTSAVLCRHLAGKVSRRPRFKAGPAFGYFPPWMDTPCILGNFSHCTNYTHSPSNLAETLIGANINRIVFSNRTWLSTAVSMAEG